MADKLKKLLEDCRPHALPIGLLVIATFAVYAGVLGHEFLSNWDDNGYVLENRAVHGFSWVNIRTLFSRNYIGNYAPVHLLSYMFDYELWGLWSGGFHFTNLLVHIFNGVMLYRLLSRFVSDTKAVLFGTAIFMLHPVQVETVAWVSQRKNLLAMLFFLVAWELYVAYRDSSSPKKAGYYGMSLLFLVFALLSKSIAVIFPLVILFFDHCYPPSSGKLKLLDKAPFLLVSTAVAVIAIYSQTPNYAEWGGDGGGRAPYHGGSPLATLFTMIPVFCEYLRLVFWPVNLSAIYRPQIHAVPDSAVVAAFICICVVLYLLLRLYRLDRRIAFWPLFAITAILPVSQVIPLVTLMNDRYLYFPMAGMAGGAACGAAHLLKLRRGRGAAAVAGGVLLLILSLLSFERVKVWQNAPLLWSDTVKKSPDDCIAWEALGESLHYTPRPRLIESVAAYKRALSLNPGWAVGTYNLGVAYLDLNDFDNAGKTLGDLLKRNPNNVMGWTAYGDLALKQMSFAEAEKRYKRAKELQPEATQVHRKIGNLMIIAGRFDEARGAFMDIDAIQGGSDPENAYELARIGALAGDTSAAITWLEKALQRGYRNFDGILGDEELTPVMADGRFSELVYRYFPKQR